MLLGLFVLFDQVTQLRPVVTLLAVILYLAFEVFLHCDVILPFSLCPALRFTGLAVPLLHIGLLYYGC